jgi:hypothetical protein
MSIEPAITANKSVANIGCLTITFNKVDTGEYEISTTYAHYEYFSRCHLKQLSGIKDFQKYLDMFPGEYEFINGAEEIGLELPVPFSDNQTEIVLLRKIEVDEIGEMRIEIKKADINRRYMYWFLLIANVAFCYVVLKFSTNVVPNCSIKCPVVEPPRCPTMNCPAVEPPRCPAIKCPTLNCPVIDPPRCPTVKCPTMNCPATKCSDSESVNYKNMMDGIPKVFRPIVTMCMFVLSIFDAITGIFDAIVWLFESNVVP